MEGHLDGGLIVTIAIFLIIQLVASVWWASHVNTLLTVLQREMKELLMESKAMRENYVSKSVYETKTALVDKEQAAMWKKIDQLEQVT